MADKKRKRKPGYGSEHPGKPWKPDVIGHHQRGHGGESKQSILERERQIKELNEEIKKGNDSAESES